MTNTADHRVLVVMKFFSEGYGGTPESVLLLARNFASIGVFCDVITQKGLFPNVHKLAGLPKRGTAGESTAPLNWGAYSSLLVAGPWIWQAIGLCRRARDAGIPISYAAKGGLAREEFRRFRHLKKIPYFLLVESNLLRWASSVIFSSTIERDDCVAPRKLWWRKQFIVPEPFEPFPISTAPERPRETTIVTFGFMAEIFPLKGLRELVEGFALFRKAVDRPIKLRIAGAPRPGSETYFSAIQKYVEDQGLSKDVEWMGAVRGNILRSAFYQSLDAFLCPSRIESFGLTPLEALWHGIPVVIGAKVGCREYFPADAPALVFPLIEAASIALTLERLLEHLEIMASLAKQWRGRRVETLSGDVLAKRFLSALQGAP